jgi:hypothetical protein
VDGTLAARGTVPVDRFLVGRRRAEPVTDLRRQVDRLRAEARDEDRRRLVGQVVHACVLDGVVLAMVAALAALPEQPDDLDGLLERLEPDVGLGPAVAEDVLVERLARSDAEREAALVHNTAGGSGLGDDRGVDAHRRAGHAGRHWEAARLGERAEDGPHEGAVALLVVPGVVMVGDPQRVEPGRLGPTCLLDELPRPELLAREEVPDLHAESGYGSSAESPPLIVWYSPLPQLGHGGRCVVDPTCSSLPQFVHL